MPRPTTRVLTVLELLQARGRISGTELANELGVDGRTLRRYIAMLEELGIPIVSERGRYGGYALVAGFKLPPMMFTDEEASALALGLLAARGLGLTEAAVAVASAQAKLERVMPLSLRHRVRLTDETIALELPRAQAIAGDGAALRFLSAAAQSRQRVHLRYRAAKNEISARDFDTYGLAWRGGRWYAVGHCHLRHGLRSLRIDRIESVQPLPLSFARPEGFDALGYLAQSIATLPRAHQIEVLLHTDLVTARREVFAGIGLLEPFGTRVLLRAQADDLDWFARELSRLPFDFAVRAPDALRAAVSACARRLLRMAARRSAKC
jgi:predicted DNA-binding transcriptional regulator YafY